MIALPPLLPEGLTEIGRYPTSQVGMERALVVLAMQLPCWLMPDGAEFALLVETADADAAREQLRRFEADNAGWPPPPPPPDPARPLTRAARLTALLWALAEVLAFWLQNLQPGRWERWGELDPVALVRRREFWRPFTALFLHADAGHLLSNLGAGYFAFCAVLAAFGTSRGWRLLAAAAYLGNLGAALIHLGEDTDSLGASTAIFAALGLLTGRAIHFATHRFTLARNLLVPLGAGIVLLGLYGGGDATTDIAAHLCGFAAGLPLGLLAARREASEFH